ncbi:MAG: polysaccharide deacetylase family protein [Lentisphaerae bacterium]|nr:polysaccharide deacetylase family protein [Lentisphaerota bacterium]
MKPLTQLKVAAFYAVGGLPPARRLVRASRGRGALLLYHQVCPLAGPAAHRHPMAINVVSPPRFDEQMRCLKQHAAPCSLDAFHRQLSDPHMPTAAPERLPVVVTFDDGHRDNLEHALPVLERHQIPATLYITTGFMDGSATAWWLDLWHWLDGRASLSLEGPAMAGSWALRTHAERLACYDAICRRMVCLPLHEQAILLAALREGRPPAADRPCFLSPADVRELDRHPLITIGAHTHRHPALRAESDAVVRDEMQRSQRVLADLLGHPVRHLAFPFGSPETAAEREFQLAAECGFTTAVTTRPETFDGRHWHNVPRHSVREAHTAARLRVKLSGWNARWRQSV